LSRRIRLSLSAAGIVVVGLVVFFLLLNPMRSDISALKSQIAEENQKIAIAEQQLKVAEDTRSQGRRNQARLLELAKMMPSSPELPSLILQIQDMADKAGISWIQVSPSDARSLEGLAYSTVPLSCNFSGGFYDVSDFIYRIEQMVAGPGRLLTVKDVSLTPETIKGGGSVPLSVILTVRMTVYAFVMTETTAAIPPSSSSSSSGGDSGGTTATTTSTQ
jgi:Tfp pilus assembly protein PilO